MTLHFQNKNWFLAQVKPNCTKIADINLKRQGFETFIALKEKTCEFKGKFVNAKRPLFPGYIFIRFDISKGLWRSVNSTYGISQLVSFDRFPAVVPNDVIAQLMLLCDETAKSLPIEDLTSGDQVVLTKGPFSNFLAEVEFIPPNERVWVLMEIMGSQVRVVVEADQLRRFVG